MLFKKNFFRREDNVRGVLFFWYQRLEDAAKHCRLFSHLLITPETPRSAIILLIIVLFIKE